MLPLAAAASSSCPLELKNAACDAAAGRLALRNEPRAEEHAVCLMDFTPRTFALTLPRGLL